MSFWFISIGYPAHSTGYQSPPGSGSKS
uniref:Uncharacterized protein n=1 Tax=Anguilla anguilla TaxID=7936 RepID=A0A0E9XEG1_ANGAN